MELAAPILISRSIGLGNLTASLDEEKGEIYEQNLVARDARMISRMANLASQIACAAF